MCSKVDELVVSPMTTTLRPLVGGDTTWHGHGAERAFAAAGYQPRRHGPARTTMCKLTSDEWMTVPSGSVTEPPFFRCAYAGPGGNPSDCAAATSIVPSLSASFTTYLQPRPKRRQDMRALGEHHAPLRPAMRVPRTRNTGPSGAMLPP